MRGRDCISSYVSRECTCRCIVRERERESLEIVSVSHVPVLETECVRQPVYVCLFAGGGMYELILCPMCVLTILCVGKLACVNLYLHVFSKNHVC